MLRYLTDVDVKDTLASEYTLAKLYALLYAQKKASQEFFAHQAHQHPTVTSPMTHVSVAIQLLHNLPNWLTTRELSTLKDV